MRKYLSAVVAGIEAAAIVLAGIVIIAIPAILIWIVAFTLSADLSFVAQVVSVVWLVAHGVRASIVVTPEDAVSFGMPPEEFSFDFGLVPLGLTLVTVVLATRVGLRARGTLRDGSVTLFGATLGFVGAAAGISWFAEDLVAMPILLSALLASVFFVVPAWGALFVQHRDVLAVQARRLFGRIAQGAPVLLFPRAFRLALVLALVLVTVAAVVFTAGLLAGYAEATRLSQQLQLDVVGALSVFLLHLAYLPTFLVWTLSWVVGPGFTIGTGSSVTSFEVLLGPLPALPVFGLTPDALEQWGIVPILLVVLAAFSVGYVAGGRPEYRQPGVSMTLGAGAGAALMVGSAGALVSWLATGPIGPGRLTDVGPPPLWFAGMLTIEVLVGIVAGLLARRIDTARFIRRSERLRTISQDAETGDVKAENARVTVSNTGEDSWFRDEDPHQERLRPFVRAARKRDGDVAEHPDTEQTPERDGLPVADAGQGHEKKTARFSLRSRRKASGDSGPSFEEEDLLEEFSWNPETSSEERPSKKRRRPPFS